AHQRWDVGAWAPGLHPPPLKLLHPHLGRPGNALVVGTDEKASFMATLPHLQRHELAGPVADNDRLVLRLPLVHHRRRFLRSAAMPATPAFGGCTMRSICAASASKA